jgi:hypothetical protein
VTSAGESGLFATPRAAARIDAKLRRSGKFDPILNFYRSITKAYRWIHGVDADLAAHGCK